MKDTERRRVVSAHRVLDFIQENPLTPPVPILATLTTELTTTTGALDDFAADQDLGFGTVRGAVLDRKMIRADLLKLMSSLAETADVLDPVTYPGVAAEMRMAGAKVSYAALLARARAFHTVLVPAKAGFVEYGSPTTVDADLEALITALEDASGRKHGGRAGHISGTAGLKALCKSVALTIQKLDVIYSKAYASDPAKLAAWKAARRAESDPVPAEEVNGEPVPAPASESGSGTAAATPSE